MTKSIYNVLVGAALLVVAIAAYVSINTTTGTSFDSGEAVAMTSKTFPNFLAIGLGVLSSMFLFGAIRQMRAEHLKSGAKTDDPGVIASLLTKQTALTLGVIGLLFAYAYLLKTIHFSILTFCFLLAGFYLFGERRLVLNCTVAAVGAAVFYLLFVTVLQLPLNP